MRGRLRSNKGASISAALLLFLVCAVVGSLVLVAGTASAGRVSKMAELDRRYYSVASAAELLAKELSDQPVTIIRTKSVTTKTTTVYTRTGSVVTPGTPTVSTSNAYGTRINGDAVTSSDGSLPSDLSLLTARAVRLMFGGNKCNTESAMGYSFYYGFSEDAIPFTMDFTATAGSIDVSGLSVSCSCLMKSDGTILITVTDNSGSGDSYTLTVTLKPTFTENTVLTSGEPTSSVTTNASGYTEVVSVTDTITITSTVSWTVAGIG